VVRSKSSRIGETGRQYRVRSIKDFSEKIIPFFEKHQLKTAKKIDFLKFRRVVLMMQEKKHLTPEGILKIKKIRSSMNLPSLYSNCPSDDKTWRKLDLIDLNNRKQKQQALWF
jgi:hypothetical protein